LSKRLLGICAVALIAVGALMAACGGGDDDDSSNASGSTAAPDVAPTRAAGPATSGASAGVPALQAVALKAGERGQEYYFSEKEIKLKPGQVKVTLTNDGPDRPHNFVVKNLDGNGDLVATDRVNPGASVEVSFAVVTGTYNFLCTLPGHADRGAKGTIVVAN
jgi:plastocyanin